VLLIVLAPLDDASLLLMIPTTPGLTPFPYTTLFRSRRHALQYRVDRREQEERLARALLSEPGEARKRRHPPRADIRVRRHTVVRSEEHTSELQSRENLVCRLLLEKKKKITKKRYTIA